MWWCYDGEAEERRQYPTDDLSASMETTSVLFVPVTHGTNVTEGYWSLLWLHHPLAWTRRPDIAAMDATAREWRKGEVTTGALSI